MSFTQNHMVTLPKTYLNLIVGLFILDKVTTEFDINNIGYNRDEVLSILK